MKKNMQPGLLVLAAILVLVGLAMFLAAASSGVYIKTSFMPATIPPCPYPDDEFPENWPPNFVHDGCYSGHYADDELLPTKPPEELGLPWFTPDPTLIPPTSIDTDNRLVPNESPEPSNIPGFDAHDPFDTDLHVKEGSAWVRPIDS